MSNDLERVSKDIHAIHNFFTEWVSGKCPGDQATFEKRCLSCFSKNFMVIVPAGKGLPYSVFTQFMTKSYNSNPNFVIKIRNIEVRHRVGDVVLVTYEEWERGAIQSEPNNGRQSTMLLRDRGPDQSFEILHVHETWLPAEIQAAGDYDF